MTSTLYYIHDPMCSWCWAFRPTQEKIFSSLPTGINIQYLLGGLAPDTEEPMPDVMREYIQNQWKNIQQQVKGIQFNFEFWDNCNPRRSTYPACRAVIAARNQGQAYEDAMIFAIQRGYYLEARNPSEAKTLFEFATKIGLDPEQFKVDFDSSETEKILQHEINFSRQLGVDRFPSLVLNTGNKYQRLTIVYDKPESILAEINKSVTTC